MIADSLIFLATREEATRGTQLVMLGFERQGGREGGIEGWMEGWGRNEGRSGDKGGSLRELFKDYKM